MKSCWGRSTWSRWWWWRQRNNPLRSEEGDQFGLKMLVFYGDGALVCEKLCASRLGLFLVYKEPHQRTCWEEPRGTNGLSPRSQKVGSRGAPSLAPHGSPGLCLWFKLLLSLKTSMVFSMNLFPKLPALNRWKRIFC
jgi:hypothetical protein